MTTDIPSHLRCPGEPPYLLKMWGRGIQNGSVTPRGDHVVGPSGCVYEWFDTEAAWRQRKLEAIASSDHDVAFDSASGPNCRMRTVATMTFEHEGKQYPFEYDFGFGYPPDSAEFMFQEGNYSCDDNRSLFLHETYPDEPAFASEFDCGDTIQLASIEVKLLPASSSSPTAQS